jgi:hypothetical protein
VRAQQLERVCAGREDIAFLLRRVVGDEDDRRCAAGSAAIVGQGPPRSTGTAQRGGCAEKKAEAKQAIAASRLRDGRQGAFCDFGGKK